MRRGRLHSQVETPQLHFAIFAQPDVVRSDVAVNDAVLVALLERLRELYRDAARVLCGHVLGQRTFFAALVHHVDIAVLLEVVQ